MVIPADSWELPTPTLYHGTHVQFQPGDYIQPGYPTNYPGAYESDEYLGFVHATPSVDRAWQHADNAHYENGRAGRHVYEVKPTGPTMYGDETFPEDFESDEDMHRHGDRMSVYPFRVVRELSYQGERLPFAENRGESYTAASSAKSKSKKKPKDRKPEEVWYDVHKHPEGVPGGMGKSPEHHLRNRGWRGHEINEGSGKKTIQYRNHQYPDFVVSYGGGTPQKPDHNFRVLYMGINRNVPKVTRAYSVAEAMNKVEELHQLQSGLVVQPMIHDAAAPGAPATKPSLARMPNITQEHTFVAPTPPPSRRDMTRDDYHPIGEPDPEFPTPPDRESDWSKKQKLQLEEIPKYAAGPPRKHNDHGTTGGYKRHKDAREASCSLCRKARRVYDQDPALYRELVEDNGGLTEEHLHTTSPFHDRVNAALAPQQRHQFPRHPEGLGPADLGGRTEYMRHYRKERRRALDSDTIRDAFRVGLDIDEEDVARYPKLRNVISVFCMAEQGTWEE